MSPVISLSLLLLLLPLPLPLLLLLPHNVPCHSLVIAIAIAVAVTALALVVLLSSLCLSCCWMVFNFFLTLFMHNAHCSTHQHLVLWCAYLVSCCQCSLPLSYVISAHCWSCHILFLVHCFFFSHCCVAMPCQTSTKIPGLSKSISIHGFRGRIQQTRTLHARNQADYLHEIHEQHAMELQGIYVIYSFMLTLQQVIPVLSTDVQDTVDWMFEDQGIDVQCNELMPFNSHDLLHLWHKS